MVYVDVVNIKPRKIYRGVSTMDDRKFLVIRNDEEGLVLKELNTPFPNIITISGRGGRMRYFPEDNFTFLK